MELEGLGTMGGDSRSSKPQAQPISLRGYRWHVGSRRLVISGSNIPLNAQFTGLPPQPQSKHAKRLAVKRGGKPVTVWQAAVRGTLQCRPGDDAMLGIYN